MKLEKKTVLITGGTSGIGLELAKQLLARNNTVIVTGRDQAKLDATQQAFPGVHVYKSDVGDPGAIATLHDKVLAQFPALDTLVNNAGIMRNVNLNQHRDLSDVTREIETNLSGPVRMIQQFLPHLLTRQGALIVNVSSGLAFIPFPASPIYCATKAAIHSFTQSLRVQLDGTSVTVIELAPPAVETPLFRGEFAEEMMDQKGMDVKMLVNRAISGIEAGKLEIRPGLSNVLKAMSRIAPHFMLKQIAKMAKPRAITRPPSKGGLTPL
jgi:uncharacterized oxidoreductase